MHLTTTGATLFDELCRSTSTIHANTLSHPMVLAIGRGDVSDSTFRFYLEQDYQFLERFVRVLALGISAAPNITAVRPMFELLHATIAVEIDALHGLYASLRGDPATLGDMTPAPVCRAYTNHLLTAAYQHDLLLTLAAILPCQWGYGDIGRTLLSSGLPADSRFAAWIEEYASDEYHELVGLSVAQLNELGAEADMTRVKRANEAWAASAQYELDFWEMAWSHDE